MTELQYFDVFHQGDSVRFELTVDGMNAPDGRHFVVGAVRKDGKIMFMVNQNDGPSNPTLTPEAFIELGSIYTIATQLLTQPDND